MILDQISHQAGPVADGGDPDEYEGDTTVGLAVHELTHFSGDLDRATALALLARWRCWRSGATIAS